MFQKTTEKFKKTCKRCLATALAMCMLLTIMPAPVFAEKSEKEDNSSLLSEGNENVGVSPLTSSSTDYIFDISEGGITISNDPDNEGKLQVQYIKMLRDKIEGDKKKPKRIITVWGVGYRYKEI